MPPQPMERKYLQKHQTIINIGAWADNLLKDPQFVDMLADIEKDLFFGWSHTETSDTEQREAIFLTKKGLQIVLNKLSTYSENKKVEEHDRDREANE